MVGERSSFPSAPSEPSLRRLGVGGSNGGGDRPLRAQLVVALVAVLILLAVPLYLWRRPAAQEDVPPASSSGAALLAASSLPAAIAPNTPKSDTRVTLSAAQKVKCSADARLSGQNGALCDSLPYFEEQLQKAIVENVDCAPQTGKSGSVNYVLTIDFTNRKVNVFPGASGAWKGPQARRAAECVERALAAPEWDKVQHQYRYYNIAIMATYQAPEKAAGQMFE